MPVVRVRSVILYRVRGHGDLAGDIMITGLYIFYNVYMYPEVVDEMFGLVMCEELA